MSDVKEYKTTEKRRRYMKRYQRKHRAEIKARRLDNHGWWRRAVAKAKGL